MALKGKLKVMHGRHGRTTIQEELDGQIRVFTPEEWEKELERRTKEAAKAPTDKKGGKKVDSIPKTNEGDHPLVKDDVEED